MNENKWRNEIKYVCSGEELIQIEHSIRNICALDPHAGGNGGYRVRSLYFDDYQDTCFWENENGVAPRKKYRIRIYNENTAQIFMECKYKKRDMVRKDFCRITEAECINLMQGKIRIPGSQDEPLLRYFCVEMALRAFIGGEVANAMKLFRICMVVLMVFGVLTGIGAVEYGRLVKARESGPVFLENSLVTVDGESDIPGKLVKAPEYNPGIYYEGVLLPYDKENNRLYLPQNYGDSEWYGKLTAVIDGESCPLYILRDDMIEKKKEAIRENHEFTIYVPASETEYCRFLLTITGMPLISMSTGYEIEAEDIPYEVDPDKKYFGSETKYYGEFLILDPGIWSGQYQITESAVCYHYKGASSSLFEKKSYDIDLLDYRGEKVNVSLAGMRSDSSWKLNSLYTDKNRIREITASQIWELIDEANDDINESGPNMEYVELIVDNDYKGVYCLTEPIDAKKMGLQETDVLYKVIGWEIPDAEDIQESANNGWKIQYPVRIRYPKEIEDYQAAWYPIDDYLEIFYRGDMVPYEEAVKHVDLDNFCDMMIFTMAVSASDNIYKNTYYVSGCSDGFQNYRMKQIPWDLDYTFGNVYLYGAERSVDSDGDWRSIYVENALLRLYESNPEEIAVKINERWEKYRNDFLSTDRIIALLEENRDYLLMTGAFLRERERWPQGDVDMNIDYLIEFQIDCMSWLDDYFMSGFGH